MIDKQTIALLSQMFLPQFDEKEVEALAKAIDSISAWQLVIDEIEQELDRDSFTGDIVRDQGIRAGYLSALSLIKKHGLC